ncbi:MAG: A/G-specific adenine glycosylase [Candidatus Poribacteria bacterium]|nr:A/G-specific adenine glycosylase [Candidatus Poribacteria bacterium]
MNQPFSDAQRRDFQRALLAWYRRDKRTLPWRDIDNPYAVLVSEVMLQQTQVATVIPYFERFLARFPTVESLASSPTDDVIHHWQGLGYYSRARNLQNAARAVVERFDGIIPRDVEQLLSLPGVGRYTAGAVSSVAYGEPAPILDGNVMRVLTRLFCIEGNPKSGKAHRALWEIAESLVPRESPGDFNVGLMELGALLCTPTKPSCGDCPVSTHCLARERYEVTQFPQLPPRPETVSVEDIAVIVWKDGRFLLTKRPVDKRWGGLWELPRVRRLEGESLEDAATRAPMQRCGVEVRVKEPFGAMRHAVTRYRIRLHGFVAEWVSGEASAVECEAVAWVESEGLEPYALSSPQRKLLKLAIEEADQARLFQ